MRRTRGIATGVLVAMLALAGCGSAGQGGADQADSQREYDDSDVVDMDAAPAEAEDAADGQAPAQSGTDVQAREVITTAEVSVVVPDPVEDANEVVHLAETAGGRVDERSVRAEHSSDDERSDRPASARLTVRIPAADLDAFLTDLEQVGEVGEVSQTSEDVTQAAQDLDARIEALETSTDRLLEIMAEAGDTTDLIAIEEALSQRQAELESLRSQRTYLSDQVAMSTVHISLTAEHDPVIEASGFTGGLQTGWHALITFVSALLSMSGMLLPWLVVLGIPAAVIVWGVRRRRGNKPPAPAMAWTGSAPAGQGSAGQAPGTTADPADDGSGGSGTQGDRS